MTVFWKINSIYGFPFLWDALYSKLQTKTIYNVACQPLWKNYFIQIDNACLFYKSWYKKGLIVINDLLENDGTFLSFNSFMIKYNVKVNFYNISVSVNQLNLDII